MSEAQVRGRFSASEAAFAGFRLFAREPLVALVWALTTLALGLVFGALTVLTVGPAMADLMTRSAQPDPATQMALLGRMLPLYVVVLPLSLAYYGFFYGAVNRAILRPQDKGFAYLRFGADELKQIAVLFLFFALLFVIYIAAAIVMVLLTVIGGVSVGLAAGSGTAAGGAGAVAAGLVAIVAGVGVLAAFLFVAVRLSLCTAITFDTGVVNLFGSWRLTRRRFWPLLSAYLLAWLVCVVLLLIVTVVFAAVAVGTGGGLQAAGVIFRPRMESLQAYFAPLQLVWLLLSSLMGSLYFAVLIGVSADAYAQLRDLERPAPVAPPATGF